MRIAADLDGVVVDLHEAWLDEYHRISGHRLWKEDITDWDMGKFFRPEYAVQAFGMLKEPHLFRACRPIEGALEAILSLRILGHEVFFVTAGPLEVAAEKYVWLLQRKFLDSPDDLIVSRQKHRIHADALIEDSPTNLDKFEGIRILFDQPWNRKPKMFNSFRRASRWSDVSEFFRRVYDYSASERRVQTLQQENREAPQQDHNKERRFEAGAPGRMVQAP
jgi:5'(3')-deoxyribonucleotidase